MDTIRSMILILLFPVVVNAADWAQWRGPYFNGSTDETHLPTNWSQTDNIEWSVELPGPSAATPIVSGDHVFISSTDSESGKLLAICRDRKSGELRWTRTVSSEIRKDSRSTFSSPSPATDGETVIFFFGDGEMIAYDFSGRQVWKQNLGPFAFGWTFSTSPVLYGGKLYMQILQNRGSGGDTESYILAIDPQSGKHLWKHIRPSHAVAESLEAFTTPMPYEYNGQRQLLVHGGDAATGHDLETGEELWRWETWNPGKIEHWRLVPSPVAGDGVVLLCAPKRSPVYAIPTDAKGQLEDNALLWISENDRNITSDVPTPVFYDGDFFVLSKTRHSISRVDPRSGEIRWSTTLKSRKELEASPLAADGKIYLLDFDGVATVVDTESGKVLSVISMENKENLGENLIRSSIIAAYGNLFIRTNTRLFCVGKS